MLGRKSLPTHCALPGDSSPLLLLSGLAVFSVLRSCIMSIVFSIFFRKLNCFSFGAWLMSFYSLQTNPFTSLRSSTLYLSYRFPDFLFSLFEYLSFSFSLSLEKLLDVRLGHAEYDQVPPKERIALPSFKGFHLTQSEQCKHRKDVFIPLHKHTLFN